MNRQVRSNQQLLVGFFNSAKPLLASKSKPARPIATDEELDESLDEEDNSECETQRVALSQGLILVTIFEGVPYTLWNIKDLARHCGLKVIESFKFPWSAYPGYKHARTIGDITTGKDRSAEGSRKGAWRGEERDARCYMLGLKEDDGITAANGGQKSKKRWSGDDGESDSD